MSLAGIISEKDMLGLLYNIEDKPGNVEDFMTEQVVCFDQEDSLIDITESFMASNFRRVPIVTDGKLVGFPTETVYGIAAIASQTSAYCKLSGLITEASDTQTYDDVMRYLDHLLEVFGPKRLIWGSDWPVCLRAASYPEWFNAAQTLIGDNDHTQIADGLDYTRRKVGTAGEESVGKAICSGKSSIENNPTSAASDPARS